MLREWDDAIAIVHSPTIPLSHHSKYLLPYRRDVPIHARYIQARYIQARDEYPRTPKPYGRSTAPPPPR
ncbi:MAG: hypothetical protein HY785_08505 [Oscillatoriophycideae cyanobacterium NC_groundwater_1537_Pr4_S-0.65um_50_18]|nr:hypothetical protein [Oscillatoriophycideae cyanobacterium NC_groundwater_1537_Pr4_S-0.65um_50_18]